jgi:hypothetical protein
MKPSEIATRITGFSIPIFGISWDPPHADIVVARRVMTFLEDRRVLYNPFEVEVPAHCMESVLEIRRYLTDIMMEHGQADELQENLRAMRAACRRFLERMQINPQDEDSRILRRAARRGLSYTDFMFNQALGELRGVFGIHVAQIAVKYGLDVEDQLASIFPLEPTPEA